MLGNRGGGRSRSRRCGARGARGAGGGSGGSGSSGPWTPARLASMCSVLQTSLCSADLTIHKYAPYCQFVGSLFAKPLRTHFSLPSCKGLRSACKKQSLCANSQPIGLTLFGPMT